MNLSHLLAALALVASFGAYPQTTPPAGVGHSAHHPASGPATPYDGEVRKVDREQAKVTLRHGALQSLDMPAMTMVFRTADPRLLEGLKEGDKVKFDAEKVNGSFTVTAIQVTR